MFPFHVKLPAYSCSMSPDHPCSSYGQMHLPQAWRAGYRMGSRHHQWAFCDHWVVMLWNCWWAMCRYIDLPCFLQRIFSVCKAICKAICKLHLDVVRCIHIHVCGYTLHRLLGWPWQWSRTRPRSFTWEWSWMCSCRVRIWFSTGNTLSCVCTPCVASPQSILTSSMTFAMR